MGHNKFQYYIYFRSLNIENMFVWELDQLITCYEIHL